MWEARRTAIRQGWSEKIAIAAAGRTLSFAEVIALWRQDSDFRAFFIDELAATALPAFLWEMPPIWSGRTQLDYEFVAIRSDGLARMRPDADAFASQLAAPGTSSSVVAFPNLGGDALLVAPRQIAGLQSYGHIAAFVRSAPAAQQHALFQILAGAIDDVLRTHDGRIWISTSGLGVAWLHVRIDSYPKYYQHRPYANG